MKIRQLTSYLESIAPLSYQEDYDNAGLIIGNPENDITLVLISLDCTEDIIDEAIRKNCNLIISHHPIVFKGIKKLNGKTYVERVVIKAIKNDIALYAIHTNLDNVLTGVNAKICEKLGLINCSILSPKINLLKKLVTYCPTNQAKQVREAMFTAGAGKIGDYSNCSFNTEGFGTFKPGDNTNAFVGQIGVQHQEPETKIEIIYPINLERQILIALHESHPYEEIAYDLFSLTNTSPQIGSGMIGWLEIESDELEFLKLAQTRLGAKVIRHTKLRGKVVKRVAVCGGSGSFLLPQAISAGADVFITSDFKYHEFFDADNKIIIADVGHFESEQFTQELLLDLINKKFADLPIQLTGQNTNPVNYLF